jgi:sulfite exporter TauE/SafE
VTDLSLVLVAGVLSSLHCVGMCGPIVLAYSVGGAARTDGEATSTARMLGLHAAYNGGRILSYSLVGALAGVFGMAFASVQTAGEYVSVVGGAVMVLAGLALLGLLPLPAAFVKGTAGKGLVRLHGALLGSRSLGSKLALGVLTPLLPCGILYAMVLRAAAEHDMGRGALIMALFAAGMTPALWLMGSFSSVLSARLRKGAERLAAATVILMGILLILRGLHVPYLSWIGLGGDSAANCH